MLPCYVLDSHFHPSFTIEIELHLYMIGKVQFVKVFYWVEATSMVPEEEENYMLCFLWKLED